MLIYSDKHYKKWFNKKVKNQFKKIDIMCDVIEQGFIVNQHANGYGVFDSNYKFVKSSLDKHKGGKGQIIPLLDKNTSIPYVDEEVVFFSRIGKNHFGHFLLQYLNRAWVVLEPYFNSNTKVVIVNEKDVSTVPEYYFKFLKLLGVKKENVIVLNETKQFKKIFIPNMSFDMEGFYSEKCNKIYDKIIANVKTGNRQKYDKIYVSRYAMPDDRKTYGENVVQKIFENNDFHIIYPEKLSIEEQIRLVSNCKVLAGCAGTALHLALFMKQGGSVVQIKRNSMIEDNAPYQYLINNMRGLKTTIIAGSLEKIKTSHYSTMPQIIGVTNDMKQFFDDNGFVYSNQDCLIPQEEYRKYNKLLKENNIPFKERFTNFLKKKVVQFLSCFIPGRTNRKYFRHFLERKLHM